MAIRIECIRITTGYSWDDVAKHGDWNAVKNTNSSWAALSQTAIVGQSIKIEVEAVEGTWGVIKSLYETWDTVKTAFTNWLAVKNWN